MSGWIKLHRQLLEWEWYSDPNVFRLFTHLLLKANHKDTRFQGYAVPAGSLVTGRKALADQTGLSERNIRTALKHLEMTSEVTIKRTNKFSIISITKWSHYQSNDQQADRQVTNNRPASDHQVTTSKECKNGRREEGKKYPDDFELFWSAYQIANKQRKGSKPETLKAWKKAIVSTEPELIIASAKQYSETENAKDFQYCKGAAAWLNAGKYEMDYADILLQERQKADQQKQNRVNRFKAMTGR